MYDSSAIQAPVVDLNSSEVVMALNNRSDNLLLMFNCNYVSIL